MDDDATSSTDDDRGDLRRPLLDGDDQEEKKDDDYVLNSSIKALITPKKDDPDEEAPLASCDQSHSNDDDEPFILSAEIRAMLSLAIPLSISFFCRMGMASTDSAFVGHISTPRHSAETFLAAAVLSDMVVNVLMVPPLAFNQVLNALVGQAMGSNNPKMAGIWLQQSMFWLSLTMMPCLVGCFYVEPILKVLAFPPDVCECAGVYAKYNVIWPIPNGLYQCMRFYFQAQGLPKPAMYNNLTFLFVNALLNWIFVLGGPFRYWFGWDGLGFIGAAISLSISRTSQSVVYFLYMFVYKKHHTRTWPGLSLSHHTRARTWEFLKQSLPNMGTLLFQQVASQASTVLIGRLGELAIASSSALQTVTIPWSGTLSATTWTVSSVRVGYHLGRGDAHAARQSAYMVLVFITLVCVVMSAIFLPLRREVMDVATDDEDVINLGAILVPATLLGTFLSLVVGNITSGVFGGMGRPIISTILSFGLELPLSIGGVALLILYFHADLLAVTWFTAISGLFEAVLVLAIMGCSDWKKCAQEARERQESAQSAPTAAAVAPESALPDGADDSERDNNDEEDQERTEDDDMVDLLERQKAE